MLHAPLLVAWASVAFGVAVSTTSSTAVASMPTGPAPATAFPPPEPCSGNCSAFEDQAMIRRRSDGVYFRFAFDSSNNNDILFTSKNIGGPWKVLTTKVLHGTPESPFGKKDTPWAPDIQYVDGQYVLFYTDHHTPDLPGGGSANVTISYATSKNMEPGTFIDHGPIGVPEEGRILYSRIGGNLLAGANPPQVAFGSDRWGIFGVNVSIELPRIKLASKAPPVELIASQNPPPHEPRNLTEGPYQYQHPSNGYTYLFYTVGLNFPPNDAPYGDYERIEVCRSKHPHFAYVNHHQQSCLRGGNAPSGFLVIQSHGQKVLGPGSPGVIDVPGVGPYLTYQYADPTAGPTNPSYNRLYGHNYMDFSSGWPVLKPAPVSAA